VYRWWWSIVLWYFQQWQAHLGTTAFWSSHNTAVDRPLLPYVLSRNDRCPTLWFTGSPAATPTPHISVIRAYHCPWSVSYVFSNIVVVAYFTTVNAQAVKKLQAAVWGGRSRRSGAGRTLVNSSSGCWNCPASIITRREDSWRI